MWEKRWEGPELCHSQESIGSCSGQDTDLGTGTSRSCHHAQAFLLVTSSAAGSSVGSLRVAGLITRIHLSRKMGKPDSVGTGEAQGPQERVLCKRQRDKSPLGTSLVPQQLCQRSSYAAAAKTSALLWDCPSSPTTSRQMHWGLQDGNEPPGKEPGQQLVLLEKPPKQTWAEVLG